MEVAYIVHVKNIVFFFDALLENDLFILFRLVSTLHLLVNQVFLKIIGARKRRRFIERNICVCIPICEMYKC